MEDKKTNNLKQTIGALIKHHRRSLGISQKELGELLGTDKQYVWRLEKGQINLTIDFLEKVIRSLNCTTRDFFKIDQ